MGHGHDSVKDERSFRPSGGALEFGEHSTEALRREIRGKLGVGLGGVRLLGILENIFECEGQSGHEVVFVFDAAFPDAAVGVEARLSVAEGGWGGTATGEALDQLETGATPLYPDGRLALLRGTRDDVPVESGART